MRLLIDRNNQVWAVRSLIFEECANFQHPGSVRGSWRLEKPGFFEKPGFWTSLSEPYWDRPTIHSDVPTLAKGYDDVVIDGPPRVSDLARSAIIAADIVVIAIQPSPYDIWAADEIVKLIQEASVFKENLKSVFAINRKIVNTAIGRNVVEAHST